jgi:hypothetical protein
MKKLMDLWKGFLKKGFVRDKSFKKKNKSTQYLNLTMNLDEKVKNQQINDFIYDYLFTSLDYLLNKKFRIL